MGCEESLDFYLNLSRKELQSLCKAHNIPANRSHVQLAKSLASFFKKKNANATALNGRLSSPVVGSVNKSSLPEDHPEEKTSGAFERRTNSSECDSYKLVSSIKEMVAADRPHCQTGSQVEIYNALDSQTIKKAYNAAEGVVCRYPITSGATEGFCCSTSEPGIGGIRPLSTAEVLENMGNTRVGIECHDAITRNETLKSPVLKISSPKVLHKAAAERVPSKLNAAPSFQFFVSSEDGINLHVNLNSNPSEWINSLKDDLNFSRKAPDHNSKAIRNLADVDKQTKISPSGITVALQSDEVEGNSECNISSLSSIVNGRCNSEVFAPDRIAVTSRSSALKSNCDPIEFSGRFEGNQMISSSTITCSNGQDQLASDVATCAGNRKVLPQDRVDASCGLETSNASVLDSSMKPISSVDMLSLDVARNHDSVDYHHLKIATDVSINVEGSSKTPISFSEDQSLIMPDESQNKMGTPDSDNFEKDSQDIVETRHTDGLLGISDQQNRSPTPSQLGGHEYSVPTTGAQSDAIAENNLLNQQIRLAYGGPGDSVTEDSISAFNDELEEGIALQENESSKCLQPQNSLGRACKRSHSSEFPEDIPSKKEHTNTKNRRGKPMNLRSTKTLGNTTIPRRSRRLNKIGRGMSTYDIVWRLRTILVGLFAFIVGVDESG